MKTVLYLVIGAVAWEVLRDKFAFGKKVEKTIDKAEEKVESALGLDKEETVEVTEVKESVKEEKPSTVAAPVNPVKTPKPNWDSSSLSDGV
jgi:hypothetical protein